MGRADMSAERVAKSKSLTLRLTSTAQNRRWNREPLGALLDEATAVLTRSGYPPSARWLAEQATRALCEQIILTGQVSLPVEITFTGLEAQSPAPGFTLRVDGFEGIRP